MDKVQQQPPVRRYIALLLIDAAFYPCPVDKAIPPSVPLDHMVPGGRSTARPRLRVHAGRGLRTTLPWHHPGRPFTSVSTYGGCYAESQEPQHADELMRQTLVARQPVAQGSSLPCVSRSACAQYPVPYEMDAARLPLRFPPSLCDTVVTCKCSWISFTRSTPPTRCLHRLFPLCRSIAVLASGECRGEWQFATDHLSV